MSKQRLNSFFKLSKIKAFVVDHTSVSSLDRYYIKLHPKTKVSRLINSSKEIALCLNGIGEPTYNVDYHSGLVELTIFTGEHPLVDFSRLFSKVNVDRYELPLVLGVENIVDPVVLDLQTMPHILVAGTTGSGKSMQLQAMINSLLPLSKKKNIELCLIDPKQVEFSGYSWVRRVDVHFDNKSILPTLNKLIFEMNSRLETLRRRKCRDIKEYRFKYGNKSMSYKVVIIDEVADLLTTNKDLMSNLIILAQKCRSAGIHLVFATQHPSAKIIPGELKSNLPCKIACRVISPTHSRVILGTKGAEVLRGRGDALLSNGGAFKRFQGAYVSIDITKPKFFSVFGG